ncbi:unnamed protein product, partial [Phyllotreta striolata]
MISIVAANPRTAVIHRQKSERAPSFCLKESPSSRQSFWYYKTTAISRSCVSVRMMCVPVRRSRTKFKGPTEPVNLTHSVLACAGDRLPIPFHRSISDRRASGKSNLPGKGYYLYTCKQ